MFAPLRVRSVQDYVVPDESSSYAARRFWFRRLRRCSATQFLRYNMVWIPKLYGPVIRNSCEIAATRRTEIGWQDWLPHHENAQLRACMTGKKLFGCGGPPQACRSSRRQQEKDARLVRGRVERAFKIGERRFRQCGKRRLPSRCFGRSPEIHTGEHQNDGENCSDEKSFVHER